MVAHEHFICISSADWDNPYWTNQQHIMSRLAQKNKVLYVESLGLRQPVMQKKDVRRMIRRLLRFFRGPIRRSANLYTYSPLLIPFYKYSFVRWLNHKILLFMLWCLQKRLCLTEPILWTYVPNAVSLRGKIGEKLLVYHCVDEIAANPLIPGETVLAMEKELLQCADIVFTSSKQLYESKKEYAREIHYLPNVADVEHILTGQNAQIEIPDDVAQVSHPVLGFIGAVSNYKLDFDLIVRMASVHPEWSIVLIGALGEGEKEAAVEVLRAYKNIHLLGGRPYKLLPQYLRNFDVCLLPNRLNEYTRNMFPLKFFEYLASGRPVVATALKSLAEFTAYFYQAESHGEFIRLVEKALHESDMLATQRIAIAKKYSWTLRMEEISQLLEKKLGKN